MIMNIQQLQVNLDVQEFIDLLKKVYNLVQQQNSRLLEDMTLITDENLQAYLWESLPCLRKIFAETSTINSNRHNLISWRNYKVTRS